MAQSGKSVIDEAHVAIGEADCHQRGSCGGDDRIGTTNPMIMEGKFSHEFLWFHVHVLMRLTVG